MQVFDHSGDTFFMVVVVTNIPCCPSLDHLYFFYVCVLGSHMAAAYSDWGLTKVKYALGFYFSWPILIFILYLYLCDTISAVIPGQCLGPLSFR